jgi:hypothetical protein
MNMLHQIYEEQVKKMTEAERLQLARMIMDDLADAALYGNIDDSDVWTDEDLRDVRQASLQYQLHSPTRELNDREAE